MGKKGNSVAVQRFPEVLLARWKRSLQEHNVGELFAPILQPRDTPSQLKAAKKVGEVLERDQCDVDPCLEMLVAIHSSCGSRHPLQRTISSVLQSLPSGDLKDTAGRLVTANLQALLSEQLQVKGEGLTSPAGTEGEGLISNPVQELTDISSIMQYMEALLENFALGEMGLRLQLPLVLKYCAKVFSYCSHLEHNSSSLTIFVEAIKTSSNVLQRCSSEFFEGVTKASHWPTESGDTSPADREEWVRAKLSEILSTIDGLLLREDFPHDVVLAAAMLLAVTHNLLHSAYQPPFSRDSSREHEEVVTYWLSLPSLPSFSTLAICHAFLAKIPTSLMICMQLNGERLVVALFPIICQLFKGFTESSDRYTAARTLALWSTVARDCLVADGEGGEVGTLRQSLAPSGHVMHQLLQYIWSLWEDPIDGIRHQCKEMFGCIISIYRHFQSDNGNSNLLELAKQLLSLESPTRGKFILLSSLVQYLSPECLVLTFPDLPQELLSVMGHQALACHAGDLWSKLVWLHWVEAGESEERRTVWNCVMTRTWVRPLLVAMCTYSPLSRRHITQHCLPSLFRSNTECMEYINSELSTVDLSSDAKVITELACLKCVKTEHRGNSSAPLDSVDTIFKSSMHHSEEQIRLSALSLVCESVKTTDAPPISHLDLLLDFIAVNGNSQSPSFREPVLTSFKKVLLRIKDSSYAMTKLHLKGSGPNPSATLDEYKGVLLKLLAQQFEVLHPLSSFQRRYFSLSLLHLMATSFPPPSTQDPPANIPPVFVFRREVSEPQAQCLLQGLQDPYEANRLLCLELLLQLPARTLCLTSESVKKKSALYLSLATSPKSVSCASAACILKFLVSVACPEFNFHLAELVNHDPPAMADLEVSLPPPLTTLKLLSVLLNQHISLAERDLMRASMSAPMYGVLASIRALLELKVVSSASVKHWGAIMRELVDLCKSLSEIVSPVVCSSSPEGFLPEGLPEQAGSGLSMLSSDSSAGASAQSLLLCSWHTMKEVSLLLSYLVEKFGAAVEAGAPVLTQEQITTIAGVFTHQLTEARHRGAFEMAYAGFSSLCRVLWGSPVLELSRKPTSWVSELLESLQSSSVAKLLSVTRRSAGLPFFMQAILTAEPPLSGRACLKSAMQVLLKVAGTAVSLSPSPQAACPEASPQAGGVAAPAAQPAAVHALNILRALYRDSRLGDHVVSFIPEGIKLAIAGFSASLWPVRNSSNLLFTALVLRIFGAKRVQDEHSMENKMAAKEFFTRFPSLHAYLLEQLQLNADRLEKEEAGVGYFQPSLFPVLLLLSRLYPSPLEEIHSPSSLTPFIPLLIRCTCCSVWKTRVLVARALSLMLTQQNCAEVLKWLYERVSLPDQNTLHGVLCVVSRSLQDREKLMSSQLEGEGGGSISVSQLVLQLHLDKWWTASSNNKCVITRELYLEILAALLTRLQPSSPSPSLPPTSLSQLHKLFSIAGEICASESSSCGQDLPLAVSVRLLLLAPRYSSVLTNLAPPGLSPSSLAEVLVKMLRCCKEEELFGCLLEGVGGLRRVEGVGGLSRGSGGAVEGVGALGEGGEGERSDEREGMDKVEEDVRNILFEQVLEESDADLLIQSLRYLVSTANSSLAGHRHFNEAVSRTYHLFLASHCRIELRVCLIQFLTVSLPLLPLSESLQYIEGLLVAFEGLAVQTQSFHIREAVAANLLRVWPVVRRGEGVPLTKCCQLLVRMLQDSDGEVRQEMAGGVSGLLQGVKEDIPAHLNPSSALKFFLSSLPQLIPNQHLCLTLLLSLLPTTPGPQDPPLNTPRPQDPPHNTPGPQDPPHNTPGPQDPPLNTPGPQDPPHDTPGPQDPPLDTPGPLLDTNPLFDPDPVNDYAEDLVLVENIATALREVVDTLVERGEVLEGHYWELSKHVTLEKRVLAPSSGSTWWVWSHELLRQRKDQLLRPLLTTVGVAVGGVCGLEQIVRDTSNQDKS